MIKYEFSEGDLVFFPHQQQVLSRDPDRVGEGVIILVLHKLLRVSRPHFDLKKQEGNQSGLNPVNHPKYECWI